MQTPGINRTHNPQHARRQTYAFDPATTEIGSSGVTLNRTPILVNRQERHSAWYQYPTGSENALAVYELAPPCTIEWSDERNLKDVEGISSGTIRDTIPEFYCGTEERDRSSTVVKVLCYWWGPR